MNADPQPLDIDAIQKTLEWFFEVYALDRDFSEEDAEVMREAVVVLNQALELNPDDPALCGILSRVLLYKINGVQDYSRAFTLARQAAEGDDLQGRHALGTMLAEGLGIGRDPQRATAHFRVAADKGFAPSLHALGLTAIQEEKVDVALIYLVPAANQNYAPARTVLAHLHLTGNGVEKNGIEALTLLTPAAEKGYAQAQYLLGFMYENGYGIEQDYAQALQWHTAAAEQGLAVSQCALGYMYLRGEGTEENLDEAIRWFNAALEQRHEDAKEGLETARGLKNLDGVIEALSGISTDDPGLP